MYKIEKGIPVPRKNVKYPFLEMEVGDSVFFLLNRPSAQGSRHRFMEGKRSGNFSEGQSKVGCASGGLSDPMGNVK